MGIPDLNETNLLDRALILADENPQLAKTLALSFLEGIVRPKKEEKVGNRTQSNAKRKEPPSRRKQKRQEYAAFQKRYQKNRKRAFDSLYNKNSVADSLSGEVVFMFWEHLLTHKSITDLPSYDIWSAAGWLRP